MSPTGEMISIGYDEICALLDRFSYKPNFQVTCRRDPHGIPHVVIDMYVPDSRKTHRPLKDPKSEQECRDWFLNQDFKMIPVGTTRYLRAVPGPDVEKGFYCWLRSELIGFEIHEMDEWFKVDDQPLNNPHDPGYNDPTLPELMRAVCA